MSHQTRIKIAASLTALFVAGLIAAGVATSDSGEAGPQATQVEAPAQPPAAQTTATMPAQGAAPVLPAGSAEIATVEDDDSDDDGYEGRELEDEGEDD